MRIEFVTGGPVAAKATAWLDNHGQGEVTPKPAATVMLLRDGTSGGVEVFMMRRVSTMKFAPSMWVFPGGGLDTRDANPGVPWAGPSRAEWGDRLGVPPAEAAGLLVAAAREVFEECGVLLAGPVDGTVVGEVGSVASDQDREALLDRSMSFGDLLSSKDLHLQTGLMRLSDHWITPAFEPRRYDTWFFTARLPHGQEPDDVSTEADEVAWVRPADLLGRAGVGQAMLFPPTRVQLERLATATDVEAVLAAEPVVKTVVPRAERHGDDIVLVTELPDQPEPLYQGGLQESSS